MNYTTPFQAEDDFTYDQSVAEFSEFIDTGEREPGSSLQEADTGAGGLLPGMIITSTLKASQLNKLLPKGFMFENSHDVRYREEQLKRRVEQWKEKML